ncbi:MAG: FAD:protein FMN transferase [Pseudomonadota bacterium]
MHRRNFLIAGGATVARLALPAGVVAIAGCAGTVAEPVGFDGATMGTGYAVRLRGHPGDRQLAQVRTAVDAALREVDARMSTYRDSSELMGLNRLSAATWQPLSRATFSVVAEAWNMSRESGGAFDATVGPLVDLWGFGPPGSISAAPAPAAVDGLMERVGWNALELDLNAGRVRKQRDNLSLDLSGIAKGYGVDSVAAVLDAHGIDDYLIEIGGELRSKGARPGGKSWRVAIERPEVGVRAVQRVVDLAGGAIATSGDYRNFFEDGEARYAHTLDPRSGRPVQHTLASVSVIDGSAMTADAASTTLMVMGPDAGYDWAERRGLAAHFLIRERGGHVVERWTPAFERHLVI